MANIFSDILRPVTGPVLTAGVAAPAKGVRPLTSFSPLKKKLQLGTEDVTILVLGDSTGDATGEWVYLFGAFLGSRYPTHSVDYRVWNTSAYQAPTTISTGSGTRSIHIYNASVAGTRAGYFMGALFASAVEAVDADIVIFSYGLNHAADATRAIIEADLMVSVDQVRMAKPAVTIAATIQNPERDTSAMAVVNTSWQDISALSPDLLLFDVYSRFINAGKPAGWYTDNQHPNATGQAEWVAVLEAAWNSSRAGDFAPEPAFFLTHSATLPPNGTLASTGTSAPTSWTAFGTIACSRETTIKPADKADSLKLTGSGAATTRIAIFLNSTQIAAAKGKNIFVTARLFIPEAAPTTMGRIGIGTNGTGNIGEIFAMPNVVRKGGWALFGLGPYPVPADATSMSATIYVNTAAAQTADSIYADQFAIAIGSVPRSID